MSNTEQRLLESEGSMHRLIDAIPQIVWTNNADGITNYFNRRWYEYTVLNYEQLAGPSWQAVIHPDDASALKQGWQGAVKTGEVFECEYRLRNAAGEYRWFIGRTVPLRDNNRISGWLGSATDIHELKQAEAAWKESDERYRLMVDGARDYAIFMLNPSNEIVYWSAGAERVFGWSAAEAVGESGELVFTPEDRENEQEEKEIETALRKGCATDRRWHMRKDGTRMWMDGMMRRLDDEKTGALRGFAKIARDATQQHEAEEQLQRAHDELERRVQERTAELEHTNAKLRQAMEQRQMLEKQILRITEQERARISQDLHDTLCQALTGTAFLLKSGARGIEGQSRVAADSLMEAADTVNTNAQMARDLARGLHPIEIGASGLPAALRELCSRTTEDVSCRCDCPRSLRIDENVAVNLYRIAQEALTIQRSTPRRARSRSL
jgi:PAS domain S-box-containing protein